MSSIHLTDQHWAFIQPLLPPPAHTGRPRADDRRTLEGILYLLITGCRWQDLPREYGAPTTVWRRLKRWGEAGVWACTWRVALAALDRHRQLDWTMAFLDGSCVPARNGGDKVGLTKKGKGTKWMLVVDGNGLPLGFLLDSANVAEVKLAEQTLDTIHVARSLGHPKRRPGKLEADRGYDNSAFRAALRRRGIAMCIPAKRRPARWKAKRGRPVVARKEEYGLRYTVERSFAWLRNYRRLLIRWERRCTVYRSWFAFAVMLLCVRRCGVVELPTERRRLRSELTRQPGRKGAMMVDFLRGTLVAERRELEALDYGPRRLHGCLEVDLEGGQRVSILDELQRLTEYLHLHIGTAYRFALGPLGPRDPRTMPQMTCHQSWAATTRTCGGKRRCGGVAFSATCAGHYPRSGQRWRAT